MVNWDSLKTAESGWRLDAAQRQRIFENCLRGERIGGFQWQFVWKPVAYLATAAAMLMLALFFWQQRDGAEKIIVPGSPGAKPAPYVENETDVSEPNGTEQPDVYYEPEDGNLDAESPAVDSESPAVDSESPSEEQGIVKFWETVPEMSLDEAKKIIEKKIETIKSNQAVGTLTDEERMALYVLNSKFYDVYNEKYPYNEDSSETVLSTFSIFLYLNDDFSGDVAEYLQNTWKKESFANGCDIKECTIGIRDPIDDDGNLGKFPLSSRFPSMYGIDDFVDGELWGFTNKTGKIEITFYPVNEKKLKTIEFSEFHKGLLRYYLSLEEVAYLEGPNFHTLVEIIE